MQLYPESWGQSANPSSGVWGSQWIADHATSQKSANKPVTLEEFGVTTNQTGVYTAWLNTVLSSGLAGEIIWCVLCLSPGRVCASGGADCTTTGKRARISLWATLPTMAMP